MPEGTDIRSLVSELAPTATDVGGEGAGPFRLAVSLRRRANAVERIEEGWDLLHVPYADAGVLAEEIASYGPDAVVAGPGEVLDGVVRRLRTIAGVGV